MATLERRVQVLEERADRGPGFEFIVVEVVRMRAKARGIQTATVRGEVLVRQPGETEEALLERARCKAGVGYPKGVVPTIVLDRDDRAA